MPVSIAGLPAFLLYLVVSGVLTAAYLTVYMLATSHDELALIRRNVPAAAVSLGLSLIGFALPLASAIVATHNALEAAIWGLVALIVQVGIYWLVRLVLRDVSARIAAGEMAAAILLGTASLAAGIINAACMS